VTSSVTE